MTAFDDAIGALNAQLVTGPSGTITPAKLRGLISAIAAALNDQDAVLSEAVGNAAPAAHSHEPEDVDGLPAALANMLPRDGSAAMTGDLELVGAPTQEDHAATKLYVDQAAAAATAAANPVGSSILWNMSSPPAGYLEENGAAVSRTTYAALFAVLVKSATVTISIATPGVVTWTSHGRKANDVVKFSTTGALPTGLVASTTYYVVGASITTNTFQLSATPGGAAINTSGSQSGVHTAIHAPHGTGDGSTTFNVPDTRGEFVRGWDNAAGRDANRSLGSWQDDATAVNGLSATTTATVNIQSLQPNTGGALDLARGPSAGAVSLSSTDTETRPRNRAKMYCIKH